MSLRSLVKRFLETSRFHKSGETKVLIVILTFVVLTLSVNNLSIPISLKERLKIHKKEMTPLILQLLVRTSTTTFDLSSPLMFLKLKFSIHIFF